MILPGPALARTEEPGALRSYVQARAAATGGSLDAATRGFAEALAAAPANRVLAQGAFDHAIEAGDRALAVRAATALAAAGEAAPEVRLTLLAESVRSGEWRAAGEQIDRIAEDEVFGFMAPILRAWVALGSRRGDPLALIDAAGANALAQNYVPENRALIDLARRRGSAADAFAAFVAGSGPRATRLRIAGAALLARRGDRREALALLAGEGEPLARARALVSARRPVPGEIGTASAGIGEFLLRLALDLNSQEVRPMALTFSRLATFLAPDNSEAALVVAELLAADGRHEAALAALEAVPAHDPFASAAADMRARMLLASGDREAALSAAQAAAEAEGARISDWTRLGDLFVELDRHGEGADAYARAITMAGEGNAEAPLWALHLIHGGALERAGRWEEGRAALQRAHALAPDQPLVLNYLGYAQLERRENVEEATRLVAEAHRLAPDNASITDSLGWAYYLAGDLPRAIELLERAAQGEPADVTINEHLGDAYYRAGRRIEARFAWKAAAVYAEGEDAERLRAKIETGLTPQLAAR